VQCQHLRRARTQPAKRSPARPHLSRAPKIAEPSNPLPLISASALYRALCFGLAWHPNKQYWSTDVYSIAGSRAKSIHLRIQRVDAERRQNRAWCARCGRNVASRALHQPTCRMPNVALVTSCCLGWKPSFDCVEAARPSFQPPVQAQLGQPDTHATASTRASLRPPFASISAHISASAFARRTGTALPT
jgi:hypothetical protein